MPLPIQAVQISTPNPYIRTFVKLYIRYLDSWWYLPRFDLLSTGRLKFVWF